MASRLWKDNLIRSGAIDIVVIDSVAALTPKAEIEGEMGDSKMGLHKINVSGTKKAYSYYFQNKMYRNLH